MTEPTINTRTGKLVVPDKPTDGQCESCSNPLRAFKFGMWLCDDCINRETLANAHEAGKILASHDNPIIQRSREIDFNLITKNDIFNAETVSIHELRISIEKDDTVVDKQRELASILSERIENYKRLIFDKGQELIELNNKQRAIQVYLNNEANKFRQEIREQLKLSDVNYKSKVVKPVKPHQITKAKIDKDELKKYALELGIAESTLQMVVVSTGKSLEEVANKIRRDIKEGLSAKGN